MRDMPHVAWFVTIGFIICVALGTWGTLLMFPGSRRNGTLHRRD